jgi:hypothetical protein
MTNWTERLLEAIDRLTSHGDSPNGPGHRLILTVDVDELERLAAEARTALAQPEPEGVTDENLRALWGLGWQSKDPEDGAVLFAKEVLAHWGRPTIRPAPVSERLPEPGKKVLAHYLNALGKPRTIIAEWVPAKTREDSPDGDLGEYDDETDLFYWPEGWYEQIENWDYFTALLVNEGEITHWQPLPRGPHHALPLPQQPH